MCASIFRRTMPLCNFKFSEAHEMRHFSEISLALYIVCALLSTLFLYCVFGFWFLQYICTTLSIVDCNVLFPIIAVVFVGVLNCYIEVIWLFGVCNSIKIFGLKDVNLVQQQHSTITFNNKSCSGGCNKSLTSYFCHRSSISVVTNS
jgi:hypothetical protein